MTFRSILLLLGFAFLGSSASAQWTQVAGPFGGDVHFLQSYAGALWAGASSGLYHSTDGLQWDRVTVVGEGPIVAGLADNDTFYIMSGLDTSQLLTTIDGGQTWRASHIANSSASTPAVLRKSAGTLVAVGLAYSSEAWASKDNGLTFQLLPMADSVNTFDAYGDLMVGPYSFELIWLSTDGGDSLYTRFLPLGSDRATSVAVTDSAIVVKTHSLSVSYPDDVYVSFDQAATWQLMPLPSGFDGPTITKLLRNGKQGITILGAGKYAYTEDYGAHWQVFISPVAPKHLYKSENNWLVSTTDGLYHSPDAGATWTDANQGFLGHIIYDIHSGGNRLYAVTTNEMNTNNQVYYTENGSSAWTKMTLPISSPDLELGVRGRDTLLYANQLSLDGGTTWSTINYDNAPLWLASTPKCIENNKAYVGIGETVQVVPLQPTPTAQATNGPEDPFFPLNITDILLAGDSIYVATDFGLYRYSPATSDWTKLLGFNSAGIRVFRIRSRFFFPVINGVYYSDTGNVGWQFSSTGTLWSSPFSSIRAMLGVGDSVIIAASSGIFPTGQGKGLFFSTDRGLHWWAFQGGLPDAAVNASGLAQHGGTIYAAMYRQGLWQRAIQIGSSHGTVYRDDNQNGIREMNEPPLPNQKVLAVQSNGIALTDTAGRYRLDFDLAADTVRAISPLAYGSVQPAYRLVAGTQQNQDFGIQFQPGVIDLAIFVTNAAAMRPGFTNDLYLSVANAGTTLSPASVGLKLPPGATYLSADHLPTTVVGDSLTWQISSVPLLGTVDLVVHFKINNTVALGQKLDFHASVTTTGTDAHLADNDFVLQTVAFGAYDPNDKQVWPGPYISPEQVTAGEPLRYTIRFQNTGTYLAERVRLIDTLAAGLDLSTLKVLGASHAYTWRVLDGHVLEILFDQIQLPDSNSNQAASHGFFSFSIQARRDLVLGDLLTNTAAIYFDFNTPVITNTVHTEVSHLSGVTGSTGAPALQLLVAPNPVTTQCVVQLPRAGGSLAWFDANGTLVRWWPACSEKIDIEVQDLPAGVYFLNWQQGTLRAVESVVVLH